MRIGKNQKTVIVLFFILVLCCASPALSEESEKSYKLQEIVVNAESQVQRQDEITLKSAGLAASVNVITAEDIEKMSVFDITDLFRKIPGVSVFNYDQGDIGFGFQMRGFRSAGAKDTAVFVDGVPMNLVQGKINGWVDLDWLLPEMIERIEVIKGPFSALYGDFALNGAINIITKRTDKSSISVAGGMYGTYSGVATISGTDWKVEPFIVLEGYNRDAYRDNGDYQRYQGFGKLSTKLWNGYLSARLHYVDRDWGVSDYLFVDDVKTGKLHPTNTLDPTNKGECDLVNFVLNYSPEDGEKGLHATAFIESFENNQSFYFPPTPQMRFFDKRTRMGSRLLYNFVPLENFSLVVGNDTRYDDVDYAYKFAQNFSTITNVIEDYSTRQFSTGFFVQAQYKPVKYLKLMGGLRYDYLNVDINNKLDPANSGECNTDVFSPKVGLVVTPYKNVNLFANYGTGFRSAAVWEISPIGRPANFDLQVAEIESWDAGFNVLLLNRVSLGFDYYETFLEREVAVNPDTNMYENLGESKRSGFDVEAKVFLPYGFELYGSYGYVRGRLENPTNPDEVYIKGLPEDVTVVGFNWEKAINQDQKVGFNAYYLRYGEMPLDKTNTITSDPFDRYYAKVNYGYKKWLFSVEAQYTPDEYDSEWPHISSNRLKYLPSPEWHSQVKVKYTF